MTKEQTRRYPPPWYPGAHGGRVMPPTKYYGLNRKRRKAMKMHGRWELARLCLAS